MIDQRHKHVTYGSSFKDFFKGFVDFTGYSSVPGHWFPVGSILGGFILLTVLVFQGVLSSFSSIGRRSTSDFGYLLGGSAFSDGVSTLQTGLAFGIFMLIAGIILILPLTASFARRLRDVGFATWGIVILIALYYILSYFTVYLLTPVYCIVFLFVLMSLPSNAVETNSNSEFAKFFLRQTIQARQYYSQFGNPFGQPVQYDQFGNPIPNQPYFNNGMNPGFQGQPQGFNPNGQQGQPGFQGQPQGFNPNGQQGQPGFQGQPQGFNPQGQPGFQGQPQGFNPNAQQRRPNPGFQGQPQGFNPQGQPGFQGQPQGFNPNAQQGQPQGFNPNAPQGGQQSYGFNKNTPERGQQSHGFNVNEVQGQPQQELEVEEVAVEQQNVGVAPQVEVAPVNEVTPQVEVTPEVEKAHEVKVKVVGGVRSKRLQKLNKAEEEVGFKKRR
ncbi:hypothetical protein [Gemella sp.]